MVISGIILALSGILMSIGDNTSPPPAIILLNVGLVFIITGLARHLKYGRKIDRDERTDRVAFTSLAASFQITMFCLMFFWWVNYLFPIAFSIGNLAGIIIIFMAVIQIVMQIYYSRRTNL